jgi:hypothetical protein
MIFIIRASLSLVMELVGRYACAFIVGLIYLQFNGMVISRFMTHLGMQGTILPYDLGLFMFLEVPAWMLFVWLLKPLTTGPVIEIVTAGFVAIATAQFLYFDVFWHNFILPTVDSSTKGVMLLWYVATTTNYMLATLAAILFCSLHALWTKLKLSRSQ